MESVNDVRTRRVRSRSPIRAAIALHARMRRIGTTHRRLRDGTSDCDSFSRSRSKEKKRGRDSDRIDRRGIAAKNRKIALATFESARNALAVR